MGDRRRDVPEADAGGRLKKLTRCLLYQLEQAPHEAKVVQYAARKGIPLPPEFQDPPHLRPGLELYWRAFLHLSSCRSYGMGPGPIPWLAVDDYATRLGLDADEREAVHHHVRALDVCWLEEHAKEVERQAKRRGNTGGGGI